MIEVDSDTKEMLKTLVCGKVFQSGTCVYSFLHPSKDFGNINVQITAPATGTGTGPAAPHQNRPPV